MITSTMKGKRDRTTLSRGRQDPGRVDAVQMGGVGVLLMLAEWASAKSTTSLDDKIVTEIRSKLEADGKL